jgi:hypothetical protein
MAAKSTLADKGLAVFGTELELLVDQYRGASACLPPQRIAEVFGRYFALECLGACGVTGFQYASQGFVAILEALREMPRNWLPARKRPSQPPIFPDLPERRVREICASSRSRCPMKGSAHVSIRGRVVAEAVGDRVLHRSDHDQGRLPLPSRPDEEAPSFGRARRI